MTATFDLTIDSDRLQRALTRAPRVLAVEMNKAVARTVQEMARSARRHAPKAFSHLVNSIGAVQVSPLEGLVVAGMDYARMVEEGTGPQGPQARDGGGFPPVQHILDWIRVKRIVPDDPGMDQRDLAFAIARGIARKGTPPHPFMAPAFADNKARAEQRIDAAVSRAIVS